MDESSPRLDPPAAIDWRDDPRLWVEAFIVFNFAGLVGDIYLAHSEDGSRYVPEARRSRVQTAFRRLMRCSKSGYLPHTRIRSG